MNNTIRSDKDNFDKLGFLTKFSVIHTQTFTNSIIQLAFKRKELISYILELIFQ